MKTILVTLTILASLMTVNVVSTDTTSFETFVSTVDGDMNILDDDRSHNGHL